MPDVSTVTSACLSTFRITVVSLHARCQHCDIRLSFYVSEYCSDILHSWAVCPSDDCAQAYVPADEGTACEAWTAGFLSQGILHVCCTRVWRADRSKLVCIPGFALKPRNQISAIAKTLSPQLRTNTQHDSAAVQQIKLHSSQFHPSNEDRSIICNTTKMRHRSARPAGTDCHVNPTLRCRQLSCIGYGLGDWPLTGMQ